MYGKAIRNNFMEEAGILKYFDFKERHTIIIHIPWEKDWHDFC